MKIILTLHVDTPAWIKDLEKIWVEDDATHRQPGHKTWRDAWSEIYNENPPIDNRGKPLISGLEKFDGGDADWWKTPDGRVICSSYPGNSSIYKTKQLGEMLDTSQKLTETESRKIENTIVQRGLTDGPSGSIAALSEMVGSPWMFQRQMDDHLGKTLHRALELLDKCEPWLHEAQERLRNMYEAEQQYGPIQPLIDEVVKFQQEQQKPVELTKLEQITKAEARVIEVAEQYYNEYDGPHEDYITTAVLALKKAREQ